MTVASLSMLSQSIGGVNNISKFLCFRFFISRLEKVPEYVHSVWNLMLISLFMECFFCNFTPNTWMIGAVVHHS